MLSIEKKQQLVNDFEDWWDKKLTRPIIQVTLTKTNMTCPHSRGELLDMLYDFDITPEGVAKAYRTSYEDLIYLGDAFPFFYMRSTGVLGAMLGQTYTIDKQRGTIWFEEMKGKEIGEIHSLLEDENALYQRGLQLIEAFQCEFENDIALGIPNLGGIMDIVESMRGANNSLLDLYDDPEEVIRLNDEIWEAYKKAYIESMEKIDLNKVMGYSGWTSLLSQKPYFISQCDFCCMIGTEQFDEFIYDYLKKEAELVDRCFYHLDGPGAIRHLDRIIECGFVGIQWINGAGSKPLDDEAWTVIYKKVREAGLLLQIYVYDKEELRFIDHLVELLGSSEGLAFICNGNQEDEQLYLSYLEKYNVPR